MAHPLELSYNWRTPSLFVSVGAFVCLAVVIRGRTTGWIWTAVVVVVLWLGFLGLTYLRTRAYLMVDGSRLTVRRFRDYQTVEGADVTAVTQFLTANGPSYKLSVRGSDGRPSRIVAPVALLRRGHATLFTWILAHAPQAELDRRSRKTLTELQERGLVV